MTTTDSAEAVWPDPVGDLDQLVDAMHGTERPGPSADQLQAAKILLGLAPDGGA